MQRAARLRDAGDVVRRGVQRPADVADRSCQLRKEGRRHGGESAVSLCRQAQTVAAHVAAGARGVASLRASVGDAGCAWHRVRTPDAESVRAIDARLDSHVGAGSPDRYLDRRCGRRGAFVRTICRPRVSASMADSRDFYRRLLTSEARHCEYYLELAGDSVDATDAGVCRLRSRPRAIGGSTAAIS